MTNRKFKPGEGGKKFFYFIFCIFIRVYNEVCIIDLMGVWRSERGPEFALRFRKIIGTQSRVTNFAGKKRLVRYLWLDSAGSYN